MWRGEPLLPPPPVFVVFFFAILPTVTSNTSNRFHQILTRFTCTSSLSGNTAVFKTRLTPSVSRSSTHPEAFFRLTYATTASIGAYDAIATTTKTTARCATTNRRIHNGKKDVLLSRRPLLSTTPLPSPPPSQMKKKRRLFGKHDYYLWRRRTFVGVVCVFFAPKRGKVL